MMMATPTTTAVFRFMDLPPELRTRMYECAFEVDAGKEIELSTAHTKTPNVALGMVSHQVRKESTLLLREAMLRFRYECKFFVDIPLPIIMGHQSLAETLEPKLKALKVLRLPQLGFRIQHSGAKVPPAGLFALEHAVRAADIRRRLGIA